MIDFYGATALVWWALGLLAYTLLIVGVGKLCGGASRYERRDAWLLHRESNVVHLRDAPERGRR